MSEFPYLPWPLFRRSGVAAFDRSLTARSKRDVGRLTEELRISKAETAAMRERLVGGNFLIRAYSPNFAGLSVGLITLKTKQEVAGDSMGRLIAPL
jgi:ribosomal protein S8E